MIVCDVVRHDNGIIGIVLYCDTQAGLPQKLVAIAGLEFLRMHGAVKTSITI